MKRTRRLAALAFLLMLPLPLLGDGKKVKKAAWEWTPEERLAERYDPANLATRLKAHRLEPRDGDVVSGQTNPELLLPWEVFDNLIRSAFSQDQQFRSELRKRMERDSNLKGDFWERIENAAGDYINARTRQAKDMERMATTSGREAGKIASELEANRMVLCRLRARTLKAVREAFDPGEFDIFLYQVVAPLTFVKWPFGEGQLKYVEEGCP